MTRKAGHLHRLLPLFDPLLGRPAHVVEPHTARIGVSRLVTMNPHAGKTTPRHGTPTSPLLFVLSFNWRLGRESPCTTRRVCDGPRFSLVDHCLRPKPAKISLHESPRHWQQLQSAAQRSLEQPFRLVKCRGLRTSPVSLFGHNKKLLAEERPSKLQLQIQTQHPDRRLSAPGHRVGQKAGNLLLQREAGLSQHFAQ